MKLRAMLVLAVITTALAVPAAAADARFRVNRSMEGVALGMTQDEVRDRLGRPAHRDLGPDFVTWHYRRPRMEVTFKPAVITLFTKSKTIRGPHDIGVGTRERRLERVLGARVSCQSAEGQRLCIVGGFDTGERSTVFVMRRQRVTSITISISTP
jgi:hypothetical protein